MIHDLDLLDKLQKLEPRPWQGTVYRFMIGDHHPSRPNTRGARWNPPDVAAIYTALERDTLQAELDYRLSLDVVRPRIAPTLYTIDVALEVVDLSNWETLRPLGMTKERLSSGNFQPCQRIGGAAAWLEHEGLLVPSARAEGINLVIYPTAHQPEARFEVVAEEEIPI